MEILNYFQHTTMNEFSMTCSCGDVMKVSAESREDAVMQLKTMMNGEMIAKHMAEKHPGEAVPSMADMHMMIEQNTQAVSM